MPGSLSRHERVSVVALASLTGLLSIFVLSSAAADVGGALTAQTGSHASVAIGGTLTAEAAGNATVSIGGALAALVGGSANVEAGAALGLRGTAISLQPGAGCRPAARLGDPVGGPAISGGSTTVCIG